MSIYMYTHHILLYFYGEMWKIIPKLSSNTLHICSAVDPDQTASSWAVDLQCLPRPVSDRTEDFLFLCPQLRRSWGGILVLASACIRASIHPLSFAYSQERLEIGSWILICGISMINKRTHIFFSFPSDFSLQSFDTPIISLWNLVNKISGEPLELGSWYLTHRLCPRCGWPY